MSGRSTSALRAGISLCHTGTQHEDPMSSTQTFELPISEFDLNLLAANCRDTSTEAFRNALTGFVQHELAGSAEFIQVVVDQRSIHVSWRSKAGPADPLGAALARLQSGDVARAIQLFRLLL